MNRADLVQRGGKYPNQTGPIPIGLECSGITESVGAGCKGLEIGDRIMALLNGGGCAQFVNVDSRFCIKIPDNIR